MSPSRVQPELEGRFSNVVDLTMAEPLTFPSQRTFTQILTEKLTEHKTSKSNTQRSYMDRKDTTKRSEWEAQSKCNVLEDDIRRLQSEKEVIIKSQEKQIKEMKSTTKELRGVCDTMRDDLRLELVHVRMVRKVFEDFEDVQNFIKDKG